MFIYVFYFLLRNTTTWFNLDITKIRHNSNLIWKWFKPIINKHISHHYNLLLGVYWAIGRWCMPSLVDQILQERHELASEYTEQRSASQTTNTRMVSNPHRRVRGEGARMMCRKRSLGSASPISLAQVHGALRGWSKETSETPEKQNEKWQWTIRIGDKAGIFTRRWIGNSEITF